MRRILSGSLGLALGLASGTSFAQDAAQFSPDGQWIAYESNESGRFEIYAQSFPDARSKWQVSTGGGIFPRWHPGGKELFYVAPNGRLMATPIVVGGVIPPPDGYPRTTGSA